MDTAKGTLILESLPDMETEEKIIQFFTRYNKSLSTNKLKTMIKKAPVVLSRNIPENKGEILVNKLKELGGSVSFHVAAGDHDEHQNNMDLPAHFSEAIPEGLEKAKYKESVKRRRNIAEAITARIIRGFAEANKELWIILSMLTIILAMNYLLSGHRMLLGLYTIPTLISAYVYGRRHATLTAFASVIVVGIYTYLKPSLFNEGVTADIIVEGRWYDVIAWGSILVITAYTMGTLYERNARQVQELKATYQGLIVILRHFISKDQYTENHCYRVSIYAAKIASYMHFSPEQIEDIRAAALLHDLGKLEISRNLLHKAARLTDDEYKNIKLHVEKGAEILKPVDGPLGRIIPIILSHHEHYDGSGYYASKGDGIPIEGRVLAVADVYDSLVSDRPYRKAMSPYEVKEIIEKGSGTDFDPQVVQAFLKAFNRMDLEVPNVVV